MKQLFRSASVLAFVCACALPSLAADANANLTGTWKLNPAKSKVTGDTFVVTEKPNGAMHYGGGAVSYDFRCDGKPYPMLADRTMTCTGSAADGYDYTSMAGSTVLAKSHRTFSADGRMLMIRGTEMHADGTTSDYSTTYKRLSGTTGLAGKWVDVEAKIQSDVMKLAVTGDTLRLEYPSGKIVVEGKMDGSAIPALGPTVPKGGTMSFKPEGAKVFWTQAYNGKVLGEGTYSVSADGRTLTEESWEPGRKSEMAVAVYEKQ